jgi:hypothetical protein
MLPAAAADTIAQRVPPAKAMAVTSAQALPLLSGAAYAVEKKKPELARALMKRMPKLESADAPEIKAALEGLRFQLK